MSTQVCEARKATWFTGHSWRKCGSEATSVPFWSRARSAWSMRLRSATALADASAAFCAASRDAFLRSAVFRGGGLGSATSQVRALSGV